VTPARAPLVLVAAMAKNRVIGRAGGIPWHLPEDLKHFRAITLGHAVIMGRATYDSMGKPLAKRTNIVITRSSELRIDGAVVVHDLESALALARTTDPEPRVIGGGKVYAEALPLATRIYLTVLDAEHDGDVCFPELSPSDWVQTERRRGEGATYLTLDRR
jgi:dihydrofolate reductase